MADPYAMNTNIYYKISYIVENQFAEVVYIRWFVIHNVAFVDNADCGGIFNASLCFSCEGGVPM